MTVYPNGTVTATATGTEITGTWSGRLIVGPPAGPSQTCEASDHRSDSGYPRLRDGSTLDRPSTQPIIGGVIPTTKVQTSHQSASLRFSRCCSLAVLLLAIVSASPAAAQTDALYQLGPDSAPQPGVPQGTVTPWEKLPSQAYPGTLHDYCVYVPAQYDPAKPAAPDDFSGRPGVAAADRRLPRAVCVRQSDLPPRDAGDDRRLHQSRPHAGTARSDRHDWGDSTNNRATEYNALDDKYAHADHRRTAAGAGKAITTSRPNPDDRAIAGASSGAICRVHRRVAAARSIPQGAQHHRQLHQHPRRARLSRPHPQSETQTASASFCRTA